MGIFDRISMIARSNINDVLDKATNPQMAMNQFMFEMEEGIKQAQQSVADSAAQQKLLEINAGEARKKANEWQKRAETAVRAGRDDLAQEALRQKANFEQDAETYEQQANEQKQQNVQLNEMYKQLQVKYSQLERDKANILARYSILKTANQIGGRDSATGLPTSDYGRMQQKIMAEQARAEMDVTPGAAAEADIDKLAGQDSLDDELKALKAKMGLGKKDNEPKKEGEGQ
ncbi:MAG: PspA/IM30 family protein [Chloroflexota bacterium]|nr:PspA/IM30 family protein [Chloroflexota bacterium]